MRTVILVCFLAIALFNKVCANSETRRGILPNRPKREPGSRTNHFRKGDAMRTQSTQQSLEAERVWGVEALDPLQQRAWAEGIWQQLHRNASSREPADRDRFRHRAFAAPMVLQYGPTAEPAAIRALNTLARIARTEAPHALACLVAPDSDPWLTSPPPRCESLHLIHRAGRFVNWREWLQEARARSSCRIVLTVAEAESASLLEELRCTRVIVPEVAQDYGEHQGLEALAESLGEKLPAAVSLSPWEQILVEAGIAEVALPVRLLARHLALEEVKLIQMMQASRLRDFFYWSGRTTRLPGLVAFRGAWPAQKIAPAIAAGEYPALFALLADIDPHQPQERSFLLALLVAFRAQGCAAGEILLQKRYPGLFAQIRRLGHDCPERQAWACFDRRACCANPTTPAKV